MGSALFIHPGNILRMEPVLISQLRQLRLPPPPRSSLTTTFITLHSSLGTWQWCSGVAVFVLMWRRRRLAII
jgi:hypothetical protein